MTPEQEQTAPIVVPDTAPTRRPRTQRTEAEKELVVAKKTIATLTQQLEDSEKRFENLNRSAHTLAEQFTRNQQTQRATIELLHATLDNAKKTLSLLYNKEDILRGN